MEEREKLIQQKNELNHKICKLEFKEKGFEERLKNIKYRLFMRTPLGKNTKNYKLTIGIPREIFWGIVKEKELIIIAIINPLKVNEHIFYVYDHEKDLHFKNGYTPMSEYINYMLMIPENGKDIRKWLRTVEEYLDEKEKETN